jgi:hypothetical protein
MWKPLEWISGASVTLWWQPGRGRGGVQGCGGGIMPGGMSSRVQEDCCCCVSAAQGGLLYECRATDTETYTGLRTQRRTQGYGHRDVHAFMAMLYCFGIHACQAAGTVSKAAGARRQEGPDQIPEAQPGCCPPEHRLEANALLAYVARLACLGGPPHITQRPHVSLAEANLGHAGRRGCGQNGAGRWMQQSDAADTRPAC